MSCVTKISAWFRFTLIIGPNNGCLRQSTFSSTFISETLTNYIMVVIYIIQLWNRCLWNTLKEEPNIPPSRLSSCVSGLTWAASIGSRSRLSSLSKPDLARWLVRIFLRAISGCLSKFQMQSFKSVGKYFELKIKAPYPLSKIFYYYYIKKIIL